MPVPFVDPSTSVTTHVVDDFAAYRSAVSPAFVPLHLTRTVAGPFRGVVRNVTVDDVHISDLRAGAHGVERTSDLIARGDTPSFKVSLMLSGRSLLIQDGREAVLEPGDLAVYDTSRPYTLMFDEEVRLMVAMFPRTVLTLPPDMVGEITAVRMSGRRGLGAVVAPYLSQLANNLDELTGGSGVRLAHTAVDLVTTVFTHELGLDAAGADPHRALLQRIMGYIDRSLGSVELSPQSIAAAHFISTRHLHELFRERDTTVSTWIRQRRLEHCRRDLTDPLLADRPVGAIAARWGMTDAAHFSRTFKAAYGVSPRDYRATH